LKNLTSSLDNTLVKLRAVKTRFCGL